MGKNSNILWTDHSFSAWHGCSKVSDGCKNCYAEEVSAITNDGPSLWGKDAVYKTMKERYWNAPLRWDRDAVGKERVFCGSMCDIFDEKGLESERDRMWELTKKTPNLIWLLLTKRPENIRKFLPKDWGPFGYENVWLGTSIENQKVVIPRLESLKEVNSVGKFISMEPLIGPVYLDLYTPTVDWVIVGGESGDNARPMKKEWVLNLKDECRRYDVPFMFKQWGEWSENGEKLDKKVTGKLLDGKEYLEIPEALM